MLKDVFKSDDKIQGEITINVNHHVQSWLIHFNLQ